ncbi:MAG: Ig-like domain-containing protein, partial [Bacteroidales bacterium]|nr:Ig-like domain-containing protein [Candidatus Colicola caccequi]
AQWRDIVWTDYLTDCSAPYTWTIWYEDPSDNVWKDAAITEGQAQFTLAKESTFNFKLRKTNVDDPRDPEDYTYYGAQHTDNSYTTSGTPWTLDYLNGNGYNVHVHAGAAGTYTINVTNMTGDEPQIVITYPTAYTITYAGGDGASGEMSPTINIAAGEDVVLPDPTTFTKTDWNCIGWTANVNVTVNSATVTAGSFIPKTATIEDINSNITLTAVWEQLVITQADELYEVVVGGTLQLTLTASYSPNITTGALYTWATNNINYATVSNTGLVTGHQAVNSGEYVTVTSSYGTVSNGYDIVVKSAACDTWGLHYWNTENHTSGDLCFENVGGDEWRTDQEHLFTLPSNSDADKLKLLYGGYDSDHAEEWAFRHVQTIASQVGKCGESDGNHYSGQDA